MKRVTIALVAASLLLIACGDKAEPETASVRDSLVGVWDGRTEITEEQIDQLHELYPEGDRDALARSTRHNQEMMVELALNDDSTMSLIFVDSPIPTMVGKWEFDEETSQMSFAITRAAAGTEFVFKVAEDGETFDQIASDSNGMDANLKFAKPGKMPNPEPQYVDNNVYATSGKLEDYYGSWLMSFEGVDGYQDNMRGTMSEEDVQSRITEFEETETTLILTDDMNYMMVEPENTQTGTWSLTKDGTAIELVPPKLENSNVQSSAVIITLQMTEDRSILLMQGMISGAIPVLSFIRKS